MIIRELAAHLDHHSTRRRRARVHPPQRDAVETHELPTQPLLPAVKATGLDGLRFHDLRHTFATLTAAGADPKQVSARAGHSSVAFTLDRYGHLYETAEDSVTARLDALLETAQPTPSGDVHTLRS